MKIFALVGVSGTGKSYNALNIAYSKGIRYIIDDGLLIFDRRRIAGFSSKQESSYISAVKRALFFDESHKEQILEALKLEKPDKIMLIGTSIRMVDKIAKRLEFGEIDEYIMIEDILTKEDIKNARYHRDIQGKHVIPLPTLEIKKDFSGYFIDTIKSMVNSKIKEYRNSPVEERTVVRPTFSYLGKYTISNRAITEIVRNSIADIKGLTHIYKIKIVNSNEILIYLECSLKYGVKINQLAFNIQKNISKAVEGMTELNILKINISIRNLT